uniref:CLK4-associating serine/arginine rich protein isoform X1 n=1 Tax=Ciona intestinalis TaxID=7719 RepID=UPI0000521C19|nr:CLK4-associating serine/arginine rich protein isoform X1 [Ciona intestinalis]|eukprot:XP_002126056.1 CLK4-associating serine/arginine rich protein isoform X1 [Ciona intestinalis]
MWHEARKQEKIVKKVIVDYRKRAERRHDFYDKIKQDPTKFMQVHGRRCTLHIDESGHGSNNHMVAWQGDKSNMIDRFDARAHLDYIPNIAKDQPSSDTSKDVRKSNYERFRILVYNKHKCIKESEHLKKIFINESYAGAVHHDAEAQKQILAPSRATIAFNYDSVNEGTSNNYNKHNHPQNAESEDESDEDFLDDVEDIPLQHQFNQDVLNDLDRFSIEFGMFSSDFSTFLSNDFKAYMKLTQAKAVEHEKHKMAGKKSRRERRQARDVKLRNRVIGRLSYMQSSNDSDKSKDSDSNSSEDERPKHGQSGEDGEEIEFITSFGENNNESSEQKNSKQKSTHSDKVKSNHQKKSYSSSESKSRSRQSHSRSWTRLSSPDRYSHSEDQRSLKHKSSLKKISGRDSKHGASESDRKPITPQEKLKLKMQRALKKQLKADRIATAEKRSQAYHEQVEREEELREIAKKIRRRDDW